MQYSISIRKLSSPPSNCKLLANHKPLHHQRRRRNFASTSATPVSSTMRLPLLIALTVLIANCAALSMSSPAPSLSSQSATSVAAASRESATVETSPPAFSSSASMFANNNAFLPQQQRLPNTAKRSLCNTFTGCGRKRSISYSNNNNLLLEPQQLTIRASDAVAGGGANRPTLAQLSKFLQQQQQQADNSFQASSSLSQNARQTNGDDNGMPTSFVTIGNNEVDFSPSPSNSRSLNARSSIPNSFSSPPNPSFNYPASSRTSSPPMLMSTSSQSDNNGFAAQQPQNSKLISEALLQLVEYLQMQQQDFASNNNHQLQQQGATVVESMPVKYSILVPKRYLDEMKGFAAQSSSSSSSSPPPSLVTSN